ncbi:chemotaxis protein CheW [Halalkalibacillus halophilus]|uniref:chemotaxis protein CheW n=1 Tax=Halalkalibacillus halophilus TaxID=392827 RepID=UPI0003F921D0|nr:chemotaxis protein CheW [Halalkalibacillus halophilus]
MEATSKYIVFQLNNERFAINIQQVRSIEKVPELTSMPQMPVSMKGIFELRGKITPVIDLKEKLEMGTTEQQADTRVLILTIDQEQVGTIVDRATEVIDLNDDEIEEPPGMISGVHKEYITGVAHYEEKLLVLLDLDRVIHFEELNIV